MQRYHQELEKTKHRQQVRLRRIFKWPGKPVEDKYNLQTGRFRKRHALGCKKARCKLCHWNKIFNVKSVKDRIADIKYKDQLKEL